ncbi:hypothetical protein RB653_000765 [Dictyostelium firmibasis]|uniref:Uncharacterized protein n=1 Tax=Dictyostelium firmibasis TaxID=79012 RepID=A0AAN7YUK8_9MYCE
MNKDETKNNNNEGVANTTTTTTTITTTTANNIDSSGNVKMTTTTDKNKVENVNKQTHKNLNKNKPFVLNLKEEKDFMKKYIVLERYFGAKSKQTQFNCLGGDEILNLQNNDDNKNHEEITAESLELNKKKGIVDRFGVYRDIYCMDAVQWLKDNEISPQSSVITSLPDITEVSGMNLEQYKKWFTDTVSLITSKLDENNVAIVYQTDIKRRWKMDRSIIEEYVDKGYLAQKGAETSDCKVVWHKIMTAHNNISNNKATFTHMICFAKNPTNIKYQENTPDIGGRGSMVWSRAMGLNACVIAILYCRSIGSTTIIDPFCGKGSVLAVANVYGLNSVGVDLSSGKTKNSFNLQLDVETVNKFDSKVWQQSNNNKSNLLTKDDDNGDDENIDDKSDTSVSKRKVKKQKNPSKKQQQTNDENKQ